MIAASEALGGIIGELPRLTDAEREASDRRVEAKRVAELSAGLRSRRAQLELAGVDAGHADLIARGLFVDGSPAEAEARIRAKTPEPFDHVVYYLDRCRAAIADGCKLLLITGPKGRGKTAITSALVNELEGARVIEARHLCREGLWQEGTARSLVTGLSRVDILRTCRFLFIDDLGHESGQNHDFTLDALNEVLPSRAQAGLFTCLTTNYVSESECARLVKRAEEIRGQGREVPSREELEASTLPKVFGHRWPLIDSRLREHGRLVTMNGPDLRPQEVRKA